jgi:hypothetical protein
LWSSQNIYVSFKIRHKIFKGGGSKELSKNYNVQQWSKSGDIWEGGIKKSEKKLVTSFLDDSLYLVWLLNPKFTESKMGLMPF